MQANGHGLALADRKRRVDLCGNALNPLLLVLVTPLIAEYLLGSLTLAQFGLFPIMALMYGTGALLVREAARRCGRGWPTILMLGIAYGVIEEGLATQSLFNPNYLGLRLLDGGFIPALGIAGPWTTYVIVLHVVWSIAAPIGLVDAIFPERRTVPWLGRLGFAMSGVAFVFGVTLVNFGTRNTEHFTASTGQLTATAIIAVLLCVLALSLPSQNRSRDGEQRPSICAARRSACSASSRVPHSIL